VNNGANWTGYQELVLTGLSSSSFTLVTWSFTVPSSGVFNFHIGLRSTGEQCPRNLRGTIDIRDLRLWRTSAAVVLHSRLTVQGGVTASGAVTATAFQSTSDARHKEDVQPLDAAECLAVAQALGPSKYIRTDLGELATNEPRRVGFIAQEVQAALPGTWSNIVGQSGFDGTLTLDYAKLTPVLCGAIQALAARVAALEA
jgi:hypothetical protein